MGFYKDYLMENAKKIVLILLLILISCNSDQSVKHLKDNLYINDQDQICMKLSNKNVLHPSQEKEWQDTIYRQVFYYKYDSVININTVIDIESYQAIIIDECYIDKNYVYINSFYEPGKRIYRIFKKDSLHKENGLEHYINAIVKKSGNN